MLLMAKKISGFALIIVAAAAMLSFIEPKGWHVSGSAPEKYDIGLFKVAGHEGKCSGIIRANKKSYFGDEYGSLMQVISSQKFLGKRIRMTGYMKSIGVTQWAAFYLRADKEDSKEPLSFDNMRDRPITGNTKWTQYTIDIDIPLNASKVAFGALLHGPGQIWFDDINFEVIGKSTIPATEVVCDTSKKREPENLDFEQQ